MPVLVTAGLHADEAGGQAEQAIARYIDGFYNPIRRHSALDFPSPAQFERKAVN